MNEALAGRLPLHTRNVGCVVHDDDGRCVNLTHKARSHLPELLTEAGTVFK